MAAKKGLELLYNLLLKDAVKTSGPRSGILSIGPDTRKYAQKRFQAFVEGAKKQGVDLDKYTEQELKYILELNKPKAPRVIPADSPEGKGITEALFGKKGEVIKADFGEPFAEQAKKFKGPVQTKTDMADARLIRDMYRTAGPRSLNEDKMYLADFIADEAGKVLDDLPVSEQKVFIDRAEKALIKNVEKYKKEGLEQTAKVLKANQNRKLNIFKNLDDNKKLTDDEYQEFLDEIGGEDRLEAYEFDGTAGSAKRILKDDVEYEQSMFDEYRKDKLDPEDMATGGRVGFKDGMSRRKFLQIMGGLGAIPIVGKFLKFGKAAKSVKAVPIVKTPPVEGKPAWFDSLVNKVILEGDEVTKKFATKDREIVHVKALDDETTIYVYRDLDTGTVRVDVDDPVRNVKGEQEDALVSLQFKPGMADETTKGKPADTFTAVENDYRNYADGPDDYVTETIDNTVTDTKDLTSDLTKVKLYAKGQKKPTMKEFIESKKRKDKVQYAEKEPSQYAADRGPDYDPDYYGDDYDYASGGIARMLGE